MFSSGGDRARENLGARRVQCDSLGCLAATEENGKVTARFKPKQEEESRKSWTWAWTQAWAWAWVWAGMENAGKAEKTQTEKQWESGRIKSKSQETTEVNLICAFGGLGWDGMGTWMGHGCFTHLSESFVVKLIRIAC